MRKFYSYVFYKLAKYHKYEGQEYNYPIAIVVFSGYLVMQFITLTNVLSVFLNDTRLHDLVLSYNIATRRFIIIPLIISPLFIATILYFRINKERTASYFREFETLEKDERKKMNRYYIIYISLTIILMFLSILSPLLQ